LKRLQRLLALSPEFEEFEELAEKRERDGPEELFATQCRAYHLPPFEQQVTFAKQALGRLWRFDFAFPEYHLAVEIQGVVVRRIGGKVYTMGGHADVKGMRNDHAKHNAAILLGWSVLQFMPDDIKPKRAIETTILVLSRRGWMQQ
jgi:hypothetical protein